MPRKCGKGNSRHLKFALQVKTAVKKVITNIPTFKHSRHNIISFITKINTYEFIIIDFTYMTLNTGRKISVSYTSVLLSHSYRLWE